MAFIQNNQNEEDDENQNGGAPGQQTDTQGIISSGTSVAAPKGSPNKSQSFATLQSYLKPNKPQGEALAGQIATNTAKVGDEAKGFVESAAGTVGSKVQQATPQIDQNLINDALSNPTGFVKDQSKVDAFGQARNAQYQGPNAFEATQEAQEAAAKVNAANERAKLLDSESGRKQLLAETQKNQAGGITALNQALLSTNPNAAATLQGAKSSFAGLEDLLKGKATDINAQIAAGKTAADTARTTIAEQLGTKKAEFGTNLESKTKQAREQLSALAQSAMAKLSNGEQLTPEELAALNTDDQTMSEIRRQQEILRRYYGHNFAVEPYATAQSADTVIQPHTLATAEDYDLEAALEKLSGEELPFLQEANRNQAGTAPKSLVDFKGQQAHDEAWNTREAKDVQLLENVGRNTDIRRKTDNNSDLGATDTNRMIRLVLRPGMEMVRNGQMTPEQFVYNLRYGTESNGFYGGAGAPQTMLRRYISSARLNRLGDEAHKLTPDEIAFLDSLVQ